MKKWIKKSGIEKHKGALHRALHVPLHKKIPLGKMIRAAHGSGHVAHMAREALNLRGLAHHYGPLKHKRRRLTHRVSR